MNVKYIGNGPDIKGQVDHILIEYYGLTYEGTRYNTVYEIDAKGNYNIIFCYG